MAHPCFNCGGLCPCSTPANCVSCGCDDEYEGPIYGFYGRETMEDPTERERMSPLPEVTDNEDEDE